MKYLSVLAVIIIGATFGCKRKTDCRDYNWTMLFFYSKDSLADTIMHFELHKKGSNFTQLIDSGSMKIGFYLEPDGYRSATVIDRSPLAKYQFNQYDWSYTFYPSGKRVTQTDITFHKRKEQLSGDGMDDYICGNNLTFKANDSTYNIPGQNGPYNHYAFITLRF